jgi:hypothetical protein
MAATMPSPRHEAAVFSDGQVVYAAGGLTDGSEILTQIVRYSPAEDAVTVLNEALPIAIYAAGVAWTGSAAYFFGGLGNESVLNQIVCYVPGSAPRLVSARLPFATYNAAAVWTGTVIYVIGGQQAGALSQILSYNPTTDTLTKLTSTLLVGVEAPAVFWDGKLVWILGGKVSTGNGLGAPTDVIQTFDPSSGVVKFAGYLPHSVWDTPSFSDGKLFYMLDYAGADGQIDGHSSIIAFNPVDRSNTVLSYPLASRPVGRTGAWVSAFGAGYVMGGRDFTTNAMIDRLIRIVPSWRP